MSCDVALLQVLARDPRGIESALGVRAPKGWPTYPETYHFALEFLINDPASLNWGVYVYLLAQERIVVGSGGYKGKPDHNGMVEIGYEVASEYRHRGIGGEAAQGLVAHAFSHSEVKMVDARTLPERNYSARILENLGMQYIGLDMDPDEGQVWHWRITREEYSSLSSQSLKGQLNTP